MGFFGDLFHNPLKTIEGGIKDIMPLAGAVLPFVPGGAPWAAGLSALGGGSGAGAGPWNERTPGGSSGGSGGFGDLNGFMNNPATQRILNRDPFSVFNGQNTKQEGIAGQFENAGKGFLGQANGLPGLNDLGALGGARGVMNEEARNAGTGSPFGDFGGVSDPYGLNANQQQGVNRQADTINAGRQQAISTLRQQMAAQGITDPRILAVGEAHIHAGHDQLINNSQQTAGQNAFNSRQQTLNSFVPQLQGLSAAQTNRQGQLFTMGESALGNAGNIYGAGANRYQNATNAQDENVGHLLGLGYGLQSGGGFGQQQGYGAIPQQQGGNFGGFGGTQGSGENPYTGTPSSDIFTNSYSPYSADPWGNSGAPWMNGQSVDPWGNS